MIRHQLPTVARHGQLYTIAGPCIVSYGAWTGTVPLGEIRAFIAAVEDVDGVQVVTWHCAIPNLDYLKPNQQSV